MANTTSLSKAALRLQMRNTLKQMSKEDKDNQSIHIQQKVLEHPKFANAKRVALYLSLPSEVDTSLILDACFQLHKLCFVPRYTLQPRQMSFVRLYSKQDYDSLPVTNWNIKQPAAHDHREDMSSFGGLDLMVVPAMAFTHTGERLGKGGGYYDRFFHNLSETNHTFPYLIGLGFRQQIVDELPTTDLDFKVDQVIDGSTDLTQIN